MKDEAYYKEKERRLNVAIWNVMTLLSAYQKASEKVSYTDPNFDSMFPNWNKYHDLKDRLTRRLEENFGEYSHWHFITYGWVAINVN
jgi:hypothetical protein